jgi:cytochrome P450
MDDGFDQALAQAAALARTEVNARLAEAVRAPGVLADTHRAVVAAVSQVNHAVAPESAAIGTLRVLLLAGYENLRRALTLVGQSFAQFCGGRPPAPDRLRPLATELLRFDSPVQAVSRAVVRDTELSGTTVHKGDIVVAMVGSANRDERHFDNPAQLRPDRAGNDHLSFGRGGHACFGAALALTQMELLIAAIGELGAYPVVDGEVEWSPTATLRGPDRLPVVWRPFAENEARPEPGQRES